VAHYPELQSIRIDGREFGSITALDIDQQNARATAPDS
jgi:hypothetical protein